MIESTVSLDGKDGLKLFYREHRADPERAKMVIAHGLGEHSGRYGNIVERLAAEGFTIWALDHRGHGQSEGPRGHIVAFENYLDDLRAMVQLCRQEPPRDKKCFLLGHSMGGLIAILFALRFPQMIDGLIVSSPALGLRGKVGGIKSAVGKIMSHVWPGLSLSNGLDASKISHDEEVVRSYMNDKLVHDRVSARWFTEFVSAMEKASESASQLGVPILMQLAGDDHLVDVNASKSFFEKLRLKDKTIHFYDGLYHEIYNEAESQRVKVLNDLEAWLRARV